MSCSLKISRLLSPSKGRGIGVPPFDPWSLKFIREFCRCRRTNCSWLLTCFQNQKPSPKQSQPFRGYCKCFQNDHRGLLRSIHVSNIHPHSHFGEKNASCLPRRNLVGRRLISSYKEKTQVGSASPESESITPTLDEFVFRISADLRIKGRIRKSDLVNAIELLKSDVTDIKDHGVFLLSTLGPNLPDVTSLEKYNMSRIIWKSIEKERKFTFESLEAFLRCSAQNTSGESPFVDHLDPLEMLADVKAALSLSHVDGRELKPSQKTYYYLLLSYCLRGDLENAVKVINIVKDEGIPVGEDYFNALIIGNSRSGDERGAQGIVDTLQAVNLEPSAKTYATLMQAYIEHKNVTALEKTYKLAKAEVELSEVRMLKLLTIAALSNNIPAFKKILSWIPVSEKLSMDATNAAVSLVYAGFPSEALHLIAHFAENMPVSEEHCGAFLLKEMVLADVDLSTVKSACDKLMKYNQHTWNVVAECSLKRKGNETTLALFELMKERNVPLRPHYFWPILIHQFDQNGTQGMLNVILRMNSFGVPPDWETIYELIVPRMFSDGSDALQVAKLLNSANVSYSSGILKALFLYLLKQKRLADASFLSKKLRGSLNQPQILIDTLVVSLLKFEDRDNIGANLELAIPILKSVFENAPFDDKTDYVGYFLMRFLDAVGVGFVNILSKLIQDLTASGIKFSQDTIAFLESQTQLDVGSLKLDPSLLLVHETQRIYLKPREMSARDLASHAEELKGKNMNERGTLRHLFLKSCQSEDLPNILAVKKRFEDGYGTLSVGMQSALLGVYIRFKLLQPALDQFRRLRAQERDSLQIDFFKIIDLATLMVENGLTEDAFSLLLVECGQDDFKSAHPKAIVRNIVALLEAFHKNDKSGNDEVKNVLDFLIEKRCAEPSSPTLGVVIKHFIQKEDLQTAVNLFVEYSKKYNVTPCRQLLTCSVLHRDDLLAKVLASCKQRYGDLSTKHNLAFAMSDMGDISGATSILSELVKQNRLHMKWVLKQSEYHAAKKEILKLLNLIETMSKVAPTFDCSHLYLIAMKACEISPDEMEIKSVLASMQEHESFLSSNVLRYAERLKNLVLLSSPAIREHGSRVSSPE